MGDELTVEAALKELREMFPTGYIQISQGIDRNGDRYFAFEGASKDRWTPKVCEATLEEVLAQVRKWKAQQP